MLTKNQKAEIVTDLAQKLKRQKIAIFTDFRGISVAKLKLLRRALKQDGAEYKIAKKTLIDRALKDAGIPSEVKKLEGEIGMAFGFTDQALPAKVLLKFSKANETFKILGGILGDRILNAKEIITLAKLPSREALLSQLVSVLSGPMRGLVTVLQGNTKNLVVVLNKVKDKK